MHVCEGRDFKHSIPTDTQREDINRRKKLTFYVHRDLNPETAECELTPNIVYRFGEHAGSAIEQRIRLITIFLMFLPLKLLCWCGAVYCTRQT